MKVVSYGYGPLYYDLSSACANCGFRHVARITKGLEKPTQSACPHCGVGHKLAFGSAHMAAQWLAAEGEECELCASCGRPRVDAEFHPETSYCHGCWDKLFDLALRPDTR